MIYNISKGDNMVDIPKDYKVGYKHPPLDKGFNANPQNRHSGAWKKEDTARYKLEQMIKLTEEELKVIANDKEAPLFERRIARSLLKENEWKTTEAMMNQVYGQPKQQVETMDITPPPLSPRKQKKDK